MRPPGYINCPADLMASCLLEKEYMYPHTRLLHVGETPKRLDLDKIICSGFDKKN